MFLKKLPKIITHCWKLCSLSTVPYFFGYATVCRPYVVSFILESTKNHDSQIKKQQRKFFHSPKIYVPTSLNFGSIHETGRKQKKKSVWWCYMDNLHRKLKDSFLSEIISCLQCAHETSYFQFLALKMYVFFTESQNFYFKKL